MEEQDKTATEPVKIPVANEAAGPTAPVPAPELSGNEPTIESEDQTPASVPKEKVAKPSDKKMKPPMAVIVAVIFALALAAATIYVYVSGKDNNKSSGTSTSNSSQSTASSTDASAAADADSAATAALQPDDSKDVPDSDLTDQTLGLQN